MNPERKLLMLCFPNIFYSINEESLYANTNNPRFFPCYAANLKIAQSSFRLSFLKSIVITRLCTKRTLLPYSRPFLSPLKTARIYFDDIMNLRCKSPLFQLALTIYFYQYTSKCYISQKLIIFIQKFYRMFNYMGATQEMVEEGVKKFGLAVGARKMIDFQYDHAVESIQTKIYITYWNEQRKSQCSRLGSHSKCFCGHTLKSHKNQYFGKKFNTSCESNDCACKVFKFVPSRPEQCGMYWLVRRKDFDVNKWRPPCKCKHTTQQHNINYPLKCKKCSCYNFDSNFACLSCDGLWQHHEVLYEMQEDRIMLKKPIRDAYLPLSSHKNIQQEVFKKEKYQMIPNKSLPSKQEQKQKDEIHQKLNLKRPNKNEPQSIKSPLGFVLKPKYPDFMLKK